MSDNHNGCFSPYMLISSTLQTIFGFDRRNEQKTQMELAEQHQLELRKAKEEFQDELEVQKMADMRAKMALARKYRCEERYEQTVLQHKTDELREFFTKYLPIKKKCIPILLDEAERYRAKGYDSSCPLNVVLLHTRQSELNYDEICDKLDAVAPVLGNIVFQRWCDKDVSHNAAILNLHAIMGNIPTLVISPYYQGGAIHISASMWEAQSEENPMIRPLFSISFPKDFFASEQKFTSVGRKAIQERMVLVSTIISGCARDSYMLITQGLTPTLPLYLRENPNVVKELLLPENKEICEFMFNEYAAARSLLSSSKCVSGLLTQNEMETLSGKANDATEELEILTNKLLEK